MNATTYQQLAARTLIDRPDFEIPDSDIMVIWNAIGLAGEAGEIAELVKKGIFHQHGLDVEKMKKELGDCLWYIAALCTKLDLDMGEVMQANIEKLKVRYPDGYTSGDSIARADTQESKPKRVPRLLEAGTLVMCACGEEQCYKAIEVGFDNLTIYEDLSDQSEGLTVFDLPDRIALVKYEDAKQ